MIVFLSNIAEHLILLPFVTGRVLSYRSMREKVMLC